jgi:RimJ/RimL family protein N-acetyltransferase
MRPIKKIQDAQETKELIKKFKQRSDISGYQIFDLECKPEHTDCYTFGMGSSDESMLTYKELKPSTTIIRSYSPESLNSFLEHLSNLSEDQFLLFVEGTNGKDIIKSMVKKRFGYNFCCEEDVLRLDRKGFYKPRTINVDDNGEKPIVQRATQNDLEGVLSIYDEFNERVYTESQYLDQMNEGFIYVLKAEGQIAGTVTFHTLHPAISVMGGFRISKDFQKRGLGKLLLHDVSRRVLSYSEQVVSYTASENDPMVSLRKLVGYSPLEERMAFAIDNRLKPIGVKNK